MQNLIRFFKKQILPQQTPGISPISRPFDSISSAKSIFKKYQTSSKDWGFVAANLGCGDQPLPNWINIDLGGKPDIVWDISKGLDFIDSNQVDYVYHEHVLEHFERKTGQKILQECWRVLKPGGTLRVAVPDLDYVIEMYQGGWKEEYAQAYIEEFNETYGSSIQTRGEFLDICLRGWGHRYLYNFEDLKKLLMLCGFTQVERVGHRMSQISVFKGIETRPIEQSRLVVESKKPHSNT